MPLAPHQERVVEEQRELGEKLEKLTAFIQSETFNKVDRPEQFRLIRQQSAMRTYHEILGQRIAAFQA